MHQSWKNRVERRAEEILLRHNINEAPIDPAKIAKSLGLTIVKHELEGDISGVLFLKGKTPTIGINPSHSKVRVRFTIAHELGHFVLHHHKRNLFIDTRDRELAVMYRDDKSTTGEFQQEREANAFAAALLMPKMLIEKHIKDELFDLTAEDKDNTLKTLAKEFKVSQQAMAFRLANLGYLDL